MNKKRLLLVCLCLIMVMTVFSACGDNDKADDVSEKPSYVIGLSLEGLDHSYMITLRDQVLAAAEEYEDADVSVIVTDGQNSVVEQANGIEDMLTRGIDLLMIQASTSEGLMEAIASVEEKGIPYMFVGKPASGTNATTMVNNDNYEIGKNVGDWIVEYLTDKNGEPKGNVAHLSGIPGDQSSEDRTNGFLEAIKDYPPDSMRCRTFFRQIQLDPSISYMPQTVNLQSVHPRPFPMQGEQGNSPFFQLMET